MFKLKYKPSKSEEGFTMLEVLVTSLILVGFLLGSLQAITLATLLRVQAQRKTEALSFINQDKTLIEYLALTEPDPDATPTNCNIADLQDRLVALGYQGDTGNTPDATTIVASNVQNLEFLNKDSYYMARIYTVLPNTLQITWHIWDEGSNVDDTDENNPDLSGNTTSTTDTDDRSIAILTTEVVPNIGTCP